MRGYLPDHFFGIRTVVRFIPKRTRYYRGLRPAPAPPEVQPLLAALRRDGIVVIPDFLPAADIAAMRAAVPPPEQFTVSPEGDRSLFFPDADRIAALRPFFGAAAIRDLARAYISGEAVPHRRTIGLKTVLGDVLTFEQHFHMDTWRQRVKAFLFLEDVGPEQAPMTYLRGSHRGRWRRWAEAILDRDYRTGADGFGGTGDIEYLGCFWNHEVAQLRADHGFRELSCTGAAGTLVIFDGRGLHRATPLRSGRRLILTSYWIHPGGHV